MERYKGKTLKIVFGYQRNLIISLFLRFQPGNGSGPTSEFAIFPIFSKLTHMAPNFNKDSLWEQAVVLSYAGTAEDHSISTAQLEFLLSYAHIFPYYALLP